MTIPTTSRRRGLRSAAAIALTVGAVLSTSACGPEYAGAIGVSVDAEGRPVAVLSVCKHGIDTLLVFARVGRDGIKPVGEWVPDGRFTGDGTLTLMGSEPTWRAVDAWRGPDDVTTYEVGAWSENGMWSAEGPSFRAVDLERLEPGEVRWLDYVDVGDSGAVEERIRVTGADTFRAATCTG